MEIAFIEKVYQTIENKQNMINKKFIDYAVRAIMAGVFLTIIYSFCTQILTDFSGTILAPFGKLLMSYLFGIGLIFILYFGAELFTSNVMYFTIGVAHKKLKIPTLLKIWTACWLFNLIGAAIAALILVQTGLFNVVGGSCPNSEMFILAAKKTVLPWNEIFFRGILANFIVNVVIFLAITVKDDVSKLLIVPLGLVPFVYLGFEHSIANMGLFMMTWLTPGASEAAVFNDIPFTSVGALNNLLWSTLGNIIGGAVGIGLYFAFLNRKNET
ncbi:MAG: formate/nitrite transporter family protein [Chitinispirillales bacterium]|jgi:nitrite transporter NirC|nr:formate/nitrite transporter family protein [Chitinispirillales bacterium]